MESWRCDSPNTKANYTSEYLEFKDLFALAKYFFAENNMLNESMKGLRILGRGKNTTEF